MKVIAGKYCPSESSMMYLTELQVALTQPKKMGQTIWMITK